MKLIHCFTQTVQQLLLPLLFCMLVFSSNSQTSDDSGYLYLIEDPETMDCGYINAQGDIVIPVGKYYMCLSDTLKTFGIVASEAGFIGIDANEKTLFTVFNYDNGPDYVEDGLFRIVENDLIGYANMKGEIVIPPTYPCAWPFENGQARVAINCSSSMMDEYELWESDEWFEIDKTGKKISN